MAIEEACGFRDLDRELQKAGVVVLGISADSGESHARFAQKDGVARQHWKRVADAAKHPEQMWEAVRGGRA